MIVAAVALAGLLLGGCSGGGGDSSSVSAGGSGDQAASNDGRSKELAKGDDGPAEAGEIVATSADEWQQKWAASGATGTAPAVDDVDFSDHVVVGLFAGEKASGGWKIDPDVVVKTQGMFSSVTYTVVGPGKGCSASGDSSSPYLVLSVVGERVRFESVEKTEDC